ncbi:MAG: ABC transporter permease [Alphaproteobacteria bacterium]
MTFLHYARAFRGIVWRELLRFLQQRERFFAALVRPLIWLIIFAAGFRAALGISIIPPYETYITYDVYITPGLLAMIQLFNGMQSSLSMVYDREMGSMRVLLTTPLPRWFLLMARLFAGVLVSLFQVYTFLLVAYLCGVELPLWGYLVALPALILTGMMFGALGMLLSSTIKQLENFAGIMNFVIFPMLLENFAGIMNFVIFPMFFASSALYPLWKMREGSLTLYYICLYNPFTWAVELIRFSFYLKMNWEALAVVAGCTLVFLALSVWAYDPSRGIQQRKVGAAPAAGRRSWASVFPAARL